MINNQMKMSMCQHLNNNNKKNRFPRSQRISNLKINFHEKECKILKATALKFLEHVCTCVHQR